MNIGEVLSRAWEIIWKNKALWLFGFLASLAGGTGNTNFRYNLNNQNGSTPFPFHFPNWALALLVLVAIVLFVAFVILGALGRAGLVRGAWLADSGETGLGVGRLFRESQAYFWRVLLLGILIFALTLAIILVIVLSTVLTLGIGLICLLPLICLLVPAFIVLGVIIELAIVAMVGENLGVMDGLRRAWAVFTAHLGEIIAIGLIVVIASAVIGFIFGLPMLLILAPVMAAIVSGTGIVARTGLVVSLVLFVLYLPILLAVHALITSYVETAWTVTFRRLTGRLANSGDLVEVPAQPVL